MRGKDSGRCLDVNGVAISPGTRIQLWDCHGGANQQWVYNGSSLRVYGDKCLDALGAGTENGTPVQIWYCADVPQQQWDWRDDGTIRSRLSGRCLDATGFGTENGTPLQLFDCHGGSNQSFPRPLAAVPANPGDASADVGAPEPASVALTPSVSVPARPSDPVITRTAAFTVRLGKLPKRAKISLSGGGATVIKTRSLGHGRWRITVRVKIGAPARRRDVIVKVGHKTVKIARKAVRV
ncbi:MAG TPA: RICIN domain-containing protein [Solirubrobacter sp.]